mgnify:FL=1
MAGTLRALAAEFLGTFAWVCLGAGAVCADSLSGGRLGPTGIGLCQGLAVAAVFALFGRRAQGLFNPAFTAALLLFKRLTPPQALLCLLSQLLAAALAGLFLAGAFSRAEIASAEPFLGACLPSVGFRAATLIEAVMTFFLAGAAGRALDARAEDHAAWSLAVGAVASAATLAAFPLTGAAFNPARAFGPAMVTGQWSLHYVYWVGPAAGAVLGTAAARFLFSAQSEEKEPEDVFLM